MVIQARPCLETYSYMHWREGFQAQIHIYSRL